jgi:glycosyltransferase involved in cell wall biosynthesis
VKVCVIIPVYNHEQAIAEVLRQLKPFGLQCFLINDGSSAVCTAVLAELALQESTWITYIQRPVNGGKGAAIIDGFHAAVAQGFSHAIQVDADGQHDLQDIQRFLAASQAEPNKMILGKPVFDESVPKSRLYGRKITNFWITVNTLSTAIGDGMCGFRCYPLAAIERMNGMDTIGKRMDFDIDIVVRLYWQGVDAVNIETRVKYPVDGVSHFKVLGDNVMISKKHAQLFFASILRWPQLLLRHCR